MLEGLYKAEFETPFGRGTGVLYFSNGKVRGGNTALYYAGTYEVEGQNLRAQVKTKRHSNDLLVASVFGMDDINVIMDGVVDGQTITIDGAALEVPDMNMRGKLTFLTD